jgi:hypothetical protein
VRGLRHAVPRRRIFRPLLMLRYRSQGVEYFRALSQMNCGIAALKTPRIRCRFRATFAHAKPTIGRAAKREGQASKSPRNSSSLSSENGALAENSSTKSQRTSRMQSDEGASATPKDPTRASSQVGDCRDLALSSKGRKRTIMARYVFGAEDKPGERWKRRLLRP